jgi:hypothetical protein
MLEPIERITTGGIRKPGDVHFIEVSIEAQ